MAEISVDGWVAEGGHSIIEGKKNNILLFDIVENNTSVGGIGDDEFRTNHAWFHCCFEINIEDPSEVSFIPEGYTLDRICSSGWAWIKKKGADKWYPPKELQLYVEQIADYIALPLWPVYYEDISFKERGKGLIRNIIKIYE